MGLKKRNKFNAEFNMSSLTDIIFLLLIFFMLTSSLTNPNAENIDRPKSSSKTPSPQNVALSITTDNKYFVDGKEVPKAQLEDELLTAINRERQKQSAKSTEEEITVVLSVDMKETTGTIVEYMKLSNKLGVRLILATEAPKANPS